MLSDPKRLRTRSGHGYLVSWKHRLRTQTDAATAAIVARLLDDPANVASLRAGIGQTEATMDELARWLTTGLSSGALNLLKTRVTPPVLDTPPETDLFDLLPPEEAKRELESLTFEVVDQHEEGIAARYQVYAPTGDPSGSLPAGERKFVGELEADADVEVEFSAIVLPLRPEMGDEDEENAEDPTKSNDPAALGPGGTEPEVPLPSGPLGPGALPATAVSLSCEEGTVETVEASIALSGEPTAIEGDRLEFSGLRLSPR